MPQAGWPVIEQIANPPRDALVWPAEIQKNAYLRRQGTIPNWNTTAGDFMALKQILTTDLDLQNALIRIYQHVVAKFDVDGFRIDTLKYLLPSYAQTFCNAIREFCLSIGKKNFFIFGEVYDTSDAKLATFIGRNAMDPDDAMGADACLDFPLVYSLPPVAKGVAPPSNVTAVFIARKQAEQGVLSTHGDASQSFVTFLDNHDLKHRFYYVDPASPDAYDDQVALGLACLLSIQGIPCIYYGTEQGLHGPPNPAAVPSSLVGLGDPRGALGQATGRLRHQPSVLQGARGDRRRACLGAGASLRASVLPAHFRGRPELRDLAVCARHPGVLPHPQQSRVARRRQRRHGERPLRSGHRGRVVEPAGHGRPRALQQQGRPDVAGRGYHEARWRDRAGSVGRGDTRPAGRHSRRASAHGGPDSRELIERAQSERRPLIRRRPVPQVRTNSI